MDILVYVVADEKGMPVTESVRASESAAWNAFCMMSGGISGKKAESMGYKVVPFTASPFKKPTEKPPEKPDEPNGPAEGETTAPGGAEAATAESSETITVPGPEGQ